MTASDAIATAENERILRRFLEHTHEGEFDLFDELVSPTVVTHGFFGMDASDREGYRRFFENFDRAFGDQKFVLEDLIADGDRIAIRFAISAVHRGEILGIEPTGERISWTGAAIDRFEDGRIAEVWIYADQVAVLRQLGALPDPAAD